MSAGAGGDSRGFAYMLAPQHLGVGDAVHAGPAAPIRPGSSLPLRDIPDGQQARPPPVIAGSGHPTCSMHVRKVVESLRCCQKLCGLRGRSTMWSWLAGGAASWRARRARARSWSARVRCSCPCVDQMQARLHQQIVLHTHSASCLGRFEHARISVSGSMVTCCDAVQVRTATQS